MTGVDQQHRGEVERCGELPRGMPGHGVRRVVYAVHLPLLCRQDM